MGQYLQTNGDYNIKTAEGGTIRLDVGDASSGGKVVITGDLFVRGDTTSVEAENLALKDNIIVLNDGDKGEGVTLRWSGIQIDRGYTGGVEGNPLVPDASLLYDENDDSWNVVFGSPETGIDYSGTKLRVQSIRTNADVDLGDLILIGTGSGVVKVTGTIDYTNEVLSRKATDDLNGTNFAEDIIVNKGYVDYAIINNPSFQITSDNSRVILTDAVGPTAAANLAYLASIGLAGVTGGQTAVSILLDGLLSGQFYNTRALLPSVELGLPGQLGPYEITTSGTNENIYIRTQGSGKLQTNYAIQIEHFANSDGPGLVAGSTHLFAYEAGTGSSGLYFRNDESEQYKRSGELVSKNRALLFSMIF